MSEAERLDILIVGGGPGGIAAAWAAAKGHADPGRVALLDDNPAPGGQIWRGETRHPTTPESTQWLERLRACGARFLGSTRVMTQPAAGVLLAEARTERGTEICELRYDKLILATGARERFLPFPGWTLPGVLGAGGLQAQVKNGLPIAGKRVVIAGTGPLLLAVAAYMVEHGARVPIVAEQASLARLARFGLAIAASPSKLKQAIRLKRQMRGVQFMSGTWPLAAEGQGKIERVVLARGGRRLTVECDYLACGFHLVPSLELATLLGCATAGGAVRVDEWQETSVPGVYCAGESAGVGGLDTALVEGQIAGYAATGQKAAARELFVARDGWRRFAALLDRTFALREELRALPRGDTIVCRCEDVTLARIARHGSWRSAKLHTRCGMGPCQGRVCGGATEFLLGLRTESVRPPVFPTRLELLARESGEAAKHD